METCIYFKETQVALNYKGREHVIPAGLGGIAKLPAGAVSDEINNIFSERERVALRETFLSVNRRNNGPGKRGSERVQNIKNPEILAFEGVDVSEEASKDSLLMSKKLGYLFYGAAYIIPQIYFEIRLDYSIQIPRITLGTLSKSSNDDYISFFRSWTTFIAKPEKTKADYKIVKTELEIKKNYLLLGYFQDTWFINSSYDDSQVERYLCLFKKHPIPEKFIMLQEIPREYHYSVKMPNSFNTAFTFIYIKTAFNVLTYMKGQNFARETQFDEIRSKIVTGDNLDRFIITDQFSPQWLSPWVMKNVPIKSHLVVLHGNGCNIDAYVSFYREYVTNPIRLSNNYDGEEFRLFFFCNYLAKEEKSGSINL